MDPLRNLSGRFLLFVRCLFFVLYINLKFLLGVPQLELIWIHRVPPLLPLVTFQRPAARSAPRSPVRILTEVRSCILAMMLLYTWSLKLEAKDLNHHYSNTTGHVKKTDAPTRLMVMDSERTSPNLTIQWNTQSWPHSYWGHDCRLSYQECSSTQSSLLQRTDGCFSLNIFSFPFLILLIYLDRHVRLWEGERVLE